MLPSNGFVVFAKRDCPTCTLIEPVMRELSGGRWAASILSQDDPEFPEGVATVIDDTSLEQSFRHSIEFVPTLIRMENGREVERTFGWDALEWRRITGIEDLGRELPAFRPGCGSLSVAPGAAEHLQVRYGQLPFKSRQIELDEGEDAFEACFERDWSDGLPVVPPTGARVLRMMQGTRREAGEVVGRIPPLMQACTVEKVAIAAVMAGCKPEYMPLVLAMVEAALEPRFALAGIVASTSSGGPIAIVNGPIIKRIGLNAGFNALGQGTRANTTIGRALQLLVRNFGGAKPGEYDRACLGSPGKFGFCIAEDESDAQWEPHHVSQGFRRDQSVVTMFQGHGVETFHDDKSRTPEQLAQSFGEHLRNIGHAKLDRTQVVIVLTPEHYDIFREGGWGRKEIVEALFRYSMWQGSDPQGLVIVRAGGPAGLSSGILAGWRGKPREAGPVMKEVGP